MTGFTDKESATATLEVEKKDTSDSLQEISLEDSLAEKLEHMSREIEGAEEEEDEVSEIMEAEHPEPPSEEGALEEQKEQPTQSSTGTQPALGSLLGNKEIEEAATLAATVTREAAAVAQEGFLKASNEAKSFFGALWSSFEAPNSSTGRGNEPSTSIDIRERFSIPEESENILESFRCKLVQQYVASNNSFTKPKSIGFSGMFHILKNYVVFEFDNVSNGKPVVVADKDIRDVAEEDAVIVLTLSGGRTFVVGHFTHGAMEVESGMNLLRKKLDKDSK
jgi:hypothetical protein